MLCYVLPQQKQAIYLQGLQRFEVLPANLKLTPNLVFRLVLLAPFQVPDYPLDDNVCLVGHLFVGRWSERPWNQLVVRLFPKQLHEELLGVAAHLQPVKALDLDFAGLKALADELFAFLKLKVGVGTSAGCFDLTDTTLELFVFLFQLLNLLD